MSQNKFNEVFEDLEYTENPLAYYEDLIEE
jgi:hypothetical protein